MSTEEERGALPGRMTVISHFLADKQHSTVANPAIQATAEVRNRVILSPPETSFNTLMLVKKTTREIYPKLFVFSVDH